MNRVSTRAANYLEKQNVEIDRGKKEEVMAMAMKGEIRGGGVHQSRMIRIFIC